MSAIGKRRIEKLMEGLDREINLAGSTVKNKLVVSAITGDTTLTTNDSGTVYIVAQGGSAITITMPTASTSTGCHFTFILGSTGSEDVHISCSGVRGETFGAAIEAINHALIQITGGTAARGDRCDLYCDGN